MEDQNKTATVTVRMKGMEPGVLPDPGLPAQDDDDLMVGYRETSGIRAEMSTPEYMALQESGFDPFQEWGAFGIDPKPKPPEQRFQEDQRQKSVPEKEIQAETKGLEDPWVDPTAAFTGGAGVTAKMSLKAGERLFPMLTRSLTAGTTSALFDVPTGMAAEAVGEKVPALAFPTALATGILTGATLERAIDKGVMGFLAKHQIQASKDLVRELVGAYKASRLADQTGTVGGKGGEWRTAPDTLASIADTGDSTVLEIFGYGKNRALLMDDLSQGGERYFIQRADGTFVYNPKTKDQYFNSVEEAKKQFGDGMAAKSSLGKAGTMDASGAVAGFEIDEEGNISFDAEKGLAGMLVGAGVKRFGPGWIQKVKAMNRQAGQIPEFQLDKFMAQASQIRKLMLDAGVSLDEVVDSGGKAVYSPVKANAFDTKSLDFTTICPKREALEKAIDARQLELGRGLEAEELLALRKELKDSGQVVSCGACYVARLRMGEVSNLMMKRHPEIPKEYFLTRDGLGKLKADFPEIATELGKEAGPRGIKMIEGFAEVDGQILRLPAETIDTLNKRLGLRWFSWSDFQVPHVLDAMQAVAESAAKGLHGYAYTKVPDFVQTMGRTGLLINQSLMPAGTGIKNGKLIFDDVEGMPARIAFKQREQFPATVGTELMGINDKQIRLALKDPRIDQVIPFHRSGLSDELRGKYVSADWKDYTDVQIEKLRGSRESLIKENPELADRVNWYTISNENPKASPQELADIYLARCKENNIQPKFEAFSDDPNYYKLLIDRKQFNQATGELIVQKPLEMNFDQAQVQGMIKKYKEGGWNPYKASPDEGSFLQVAKRLATSQRGSIPFSPEDLQKELDESVSLAAKAASPEQARQSWFPERAQVIYKKNYKEIMASADWKAAKEMADDAAGDRVVALAWSDRTIDAIKASYPEPDRVVYLTQPSTTRNNVIPERLAKRISEETGATYIVGGDYYDSLHTTQAKKTFKGKRLDEPREYKSANPDELKLLIDDKAVVVVDDTLTTGGSVVEFVKALREDGIMVKGVVSLFGESRLAATGPVLTALDEALKASKIPLAVDDLANVLTREEVRNIILPKFKRIKTDEDRQELTDYLQGLLDRRTPKDVGADPGGRYPQGNAQGQDPGYEQSPEGAPPGHVRQLSGPEFSGRQQPNPVVEDLTPALDKVGGLAAAMANEGAPLVTVTPGIERKARAWLNLKPEDLPTDKAVNINFARIDSEEGIKEALARTGEVFAAGIDEARRGVITQEETQRLANLVGLTPEKLLKRRRGQAFNAEEALAARQLLVSSGSQLKTLADIVSGRVPAAGTAFESYTISELRFAFEKQLATHYAIQAQVSGMTAEAGRALQAFRLQARETAGKLKAMDEMLKRMDTRKVGSADMAAMISTLDTAEGLARFARDARKATSMDMLLEVWINSLLSGPTTHAANMTSNMLTALMQIPERALAAGWGKVLPGDAEIKIGEAGAQVYGMMKGFSEALKASGRALWTGDGMDLTSKIDVHQRRAIAAKNFGVDEGTTLGRAVDLLGEGVRLPGRFLTAEDEFFKVMGYRVELQAQAFRQAKREGLTGDDFKKRVDELVADPTDDIHLASIDQATYQTFMKDLGETGQLGMRYLAHAPILRLIVPFVKTPVNVVKFMGERSPLAPFSREIRADIAAGGARRDIALARMSMGAMIMGLGATLTYSGVITGGGPKDPELKASLRNQGISPYSVKIGDTRYGFNRLDPIGMMLGIAADAAEIMQSAQDQDLDEIASAAVMAIAKNVTSKTYLKGVAAFVEALDDPERYLPRFLESYAGTLVPSAAATVERMIDPTQRSTYSDEGIFRQVLNAVIARTPGYSDTLPALRNLWGQPVVPEGALGPDWFSPISISTAKRSPVDAEMVRLKMRVRMSSKTQRFEGVDVPLDPLEYDKLIVLMNEIPLDSTGDNLKTSLDTMVQGQEYKDATKEEQESMIQTKISEAKKIAKRQLYEDTSDLQFLVQRLQLKAQAER